MNVDVRLNYAPRKRLLFQLLAATAALSVPTMAEEPEQTQRTVEVSPAPGKPWAPRAVRTLADLPAISPDPSGGLFGGSGPADPKLATGFFKTKQEGGRWWLIDPEGRRYIYQGVSSVRAIATKGAKAAVKEKFGSAEGWAKETAAMLRGYGFNGIGAWSDDKAIGPASSRLAYTKLWNFMSAYGKKRGGTYQKPGHTGYPGDCPFIFDSAFPAFCQEHALRLSATREDPWLVGHFTDNELPWSEQMLNRYLALPKDDPGYRAADRWLKQRHGEDATPASITQKDREDFLAHAADTYFSAVCSAIRKVDPNHLILGARFHNPAYRFPSLFEAAGRHLDVVSVNYYNAWTPDREMLQMWSAKAGKPFMITEWYAKANDSGLANTGGAGWLVKTQQDRGHYYQNFTLALLESRSCVGWDWFKYIDNDPDDRLTDPSNRDSNKGIVTNRYMTYQPLLNAMKEVNQRSFGLVRHFDQPNSNSSR